jgi:hypothetical protein
MPNALRNVDLKIRLARFSCGTVFFLNDSVSRTGSPEFQTFSDNTGFLRRNSGLLCFLSHWGL